MQNEDVYAYCFEPPAGVHRDETLYDTVHTNIFNIVNENDPVPKVVMDSWGYHRYGIDEYLPLLNVPSKKKYNVLKEEMLKYYKQYIGGDYEIDDFHKTIYVRTLTGTMKTWGKSSEGIFLDDLLDELGETIGSPAKYKSAYQDALVYVGSEIIGKKNTEEFLKKLRKNILLNAAILMDISFSKQSASAKKSMQSALSNTFSELGIDVNEKDLQILAPLVGKLVLDGRLGIMLDNLDALKQGHFPELCLAWLDAIGESDLNSAPMRRVRINCPVNVEVYDEDGELVAAIYDDEVDDNSLLPVNVTTSGEKRVYLPPNGKYDIKITATDSGTVAYSVREAQEDGSVKVVSYEGIQVTSGNVLTGTVENAEETETTYSLEMNGYDITPDVETTDAVPVSISVSAEGGGSVIGGGMVYEGEAVKVTAVPYEGEYFLGWFNGSKLVSKDEEYDLVATENTELVAEFTENTCEVAVSDGEKILSVQRIIKGDTVTLEENPQRERGIFMGYYSDDSFTKALDFDAQYSEDTIIYAEFESALKYDDWYYFINEDGTASIAGCDSADEVLRIPSSIDGYTVNSVWYGAFNAEDISTVVFPESVNVLGENAFINCNDLVSVCYEGSAQQWNDISLEDGNDGILSAKIITDFNSDNEAYIADIQEKNMNIAVDFDYMLRKCIVYCSVYDDEGRLLSLQSETIKAGTENADFDMSDEETYNAKTVKVFIWQEETMKPLAKTAGFIME